MGFSLEISEEALVRCRRHCCICDKFVGPKIELHHIIQEADGGSDTLENCIPLCFDCHAEVKSYNPRHPKGKKYTETELKKLRDNIYNKYSSKVEKTSIIDKPALENWINNLERQDKKQILDWGYSTINQMCPIYSNSLILIAGYSNSGKTAYANHIIRYSLKENKKILYLSSKDSANKIINNLISAETFIPVNKLNEEIMDAEDWEKIIQAMHLFVPENLKIHSIENEDNVFDLINSLESDIVLIDDFNGLLLSTDKEIESFMYTLKGLLNKYNKTIIMLANMKNSKSLWLNNRPKIEDIDDNLFRLSDIVQFVYRKENDFLNCEENKGQIITIKSTKHIGTMDISYIDIYNEILEYKQNGKEYTQS